MHDSLHATASQQRVAGYQQPPKAHHTCFFSYTLETHIQEGILTPQHVVHAQCFEERVNSRNVNCVCLPEDAVKPAAGQHLLHIGNHGMKGWLIRPCQRLEEARGTSEKQDELPLLVHSHLSQHHVVHRGGGGTHAAAILSLASGAKRGGIHGRTLHIHHEMGAALVLVDPHTLDVDIAAWLLDENDPTRVHGSRRAAKLALALLAVLGPNCTN
eukprot:scaffold909_cov575-Prasinococcus_capsulatus_cf.AAC.8